MAAKNRYTADTINRRFDAEEMAIIREDYWRTNHNLSMVAQLHACHKADITAALGLTKDETPTKKSSGRQPWEALNPELAEAFFEDVEAGVPMATACRNAGIKKTDTGYHIFYRMRERRQLMANKAIQDDKITKAVQDALPDEAAAEPIQPEDYTPDTEKATAQEIFTRVNAMSELIDRMRELHKLRILSDDEIYILEHAMALAEVARAYIEYVGGK